MYERATLLFVVSTLMNWFFFLILLGFPLLIVVISLAATQAKGYGYYGDQTACWLAVDNGLIWAFVAPAIVVLLVRNTFCFNQNHLR